MADIPNPVSFVPVAKALGAEGERIEKAEDIVPAFQMPTHYLDKYAHLDYSRWMQD